MRNLIRNKSSRGFTLPEVLVTFTTFMVFSSALFGTLILGLKYMEKAEAELSAQSTCRNIISTISGELRQGTVNSDSGESGYQAVTPSIEASAVLYPNKNSVTTDYVLFTEPNFANFDPSESTFDRTNPDNYQQVRYFTENKTLYREIKTIQSGKLQDAQKDPIAEVLNGEIELQVKYLTTNKFELTVHVTEDKGMRSESSYTGSVIVYIMN